MTTLADLFSDDDDLPNSFCGPPRQIFEPMFKRELLAARMYFTRWFLLITFVAIVIIFLLLGYLALSSHKSEFEIAVYTELVSGLAMFAILPLTLRLADVWPKRTYALLFVLSVACGLAAYQFAGIMQTLFLEAAAGLLIVLGLDIGYIGLVKRLSAAAAQASEEYERFRKEWDE